MGRFRNSRYAFGALIVLAVVIGVAWGLKIKRAADVRRVPEADASVLKILALTNALPSKFIKAFEARANIKIELTEVPNPDLLIKRLDGSEKFDLITLMSSQAPAAAAALKIQPLKLSDLSGAEQISPDFLDLPGEVHQRPSVVPISWGLAGLAVAKDKGKTEAKTTSPETETQSLVSWASVFERKLDGKLVLKPSRLSVALLTEIIAPPNSATNENETQFLTRAQRIQHASTFTSNFFRGMTEVSELEQTHHGESVFDESSEFQIPLDGAELWVLSLSLGAAAENTSGADRFLEYLLKPANAAELALISHQASCNRAVEANLKLNAKLKPSYLRAVPLERIKVPTASLITRSGLIKDLN